MLYPFVVPLFRTAVFMDQKQDFLFRQWAESWVGQRQLWFDDHYELISWDVTATDLTRYYRSKKCEHCRQKIPASEYWPGYHIDICYSCPKILCRNTVWVCNKCRKTFCSSCAATDCKPGDTFLQNSVQNVIQRAKKWVENQRRKIQELLQEEPGDLYQRELEREESTDEDKDNEERREKEDDEDKDEAMQLLWMMEENQQRETLETEAETQEMERQGSIFEHVEQEMQI